MATLNLEFSLPDLDFKREHGSPESKLCQNDSFGVYFHPMAAICQPAAALILLHRALQKNSGHFVQE